MSVNSISSTPVVTANPNQNVKSSDNTDFAGILADSLNRPETDLDGIFEAASKKYNVPVNLLKAVAKVESGFNSRAMSGCGAMGVMQLMPGTAKSLGVDDAFDPEQNIMGGAKYLSQMLQEFNGNVTLAVAAYNAGAGNVKKYGGVPPFEETQNYVSKVMGYFDGNMMTDISSAAPNISSYMELLTAAEHSEPGAFSDMILMNAYQKLLSGEDGDDPFLPYDNLL